VSTAVGTTSIQAGPQPWQMIGNALGYLEPVYRQWEENEEGLDTSILVPALVGAYRALRIAPEEPPEASFSTLSWIERGSFSTLKEGGRLFGTDGSMESGELTLERGEESLNMGGWGVLRTLHIKFRFHL
ncbi:hypothetical protein ACDT16_14000, partial [Staphylococcus aureus]